MMNLTIQTRYILKMHITRLLTLLFLFYFCYIIFDFSIHMSDWSGKEGLSASQIFIYYVYNFVKRFDLLLPLSTIISVVNVLLTLNNHQELLAFQTSGRGIKSIIAPFIASAVGCAILITASYQWLLPPAQKYIDHFEHEFISSHKQDKKDQIKSFSYDNGSKLIFMTASPAGGAISDAYFFAKEGGIWHFKELVEKEGEIKGFFADHFSRNELGELVRDNSHVEMPVLFMSAPLLRPTDQEKEPYENLSISELTIKKMHPYDPTSSEYNEISTQLYSKMAMPWFSLLATIGIIPSCIRFSRAHRNFMIYAIGLLGFVSFFTIMDACVILGGNAIISPFIASFAPLGILAGVFGLRLGRVR